MSGIKPAITDVLTRLAGVQVQNNELVTVGLYTRIFNNQPVRQKQGKIQAYELPAAFVEIIKPSKFTRLLNGASESDLILRIHLQHQFTDAQDGTFDQDLPIFDLRDKVIASLSNFRPTACGNLMIIDESQDYDHDDVYVYLIEFICSFIDSKGSPYDTDRTDYQNSTPPTSLIIEADFGGVDVDESFETVLFPTLYINNTTSLSSMLNKDFNILRPNFNVDVIQDSFISVNNTMNGDAGNINIDLLTGDEEIHFNGNETFIKPVVAGVFAVSYININGTLYFN